jgi:hypothetical protein
MSREMPVWFDEFVELDAAARTSVSAQEPAELRPIIGSTTDPACCAWCGRVGGAPYCSSAHALADKASADFE